MKATMVKFLLAIGGLLMILSIIPPQLVLGIAYLPYISQFYSSISDFVVTPSGDRFRVESNGSFYAACPQAFNYELSLKKTNEFDASVYKSNWCNGLYVMNATSFRVMKSGILGQTKIGYFIINTAKRHVYVNLELPEWQKMLTQMGVPADIQCHRLPLRVDYASRGWLRYQAE